MAAPLGTPCVKLPKLGILNPPALSPVPAAPPMDRPSAAEKPPDGDNVIDCNELSVLRLGLIDVWLLARSVIVSENVLGACSPMFVPLGLNVLS
jgi:hypothetical protein